MLRALLMACALAAIHLPLHAESEGTEYALRWKSGGPSTADATVRALDLKGPQERTVYQVEYFDLRGPSLRGKAPIVRRRTSIGKLELTIKYRADAVPADFDPSRDCPLGKKVTVKAETDVSLDAALIPHPVKSISCERQAKKPTDFPKTLQVVSRGCTTAMVRIKVGGFKVEEWRLPSGSVIEVSLSSKKSSDDLKHFKDVVSRLPLVKLSIEDRSKSEAASSCG